jgi:hypothetical protein
MIYILLDNEAVVFENASFTWDRLNTDEQKEITNIHLKK